MEEYSVPMQVYLPIADLDRDPGNERLFPPLSEQAYTHLAESIRRIGIVTPVCVARRGERYVVLDGHHRLSIAQDLGIRLIPCRIARDPVEELEFLYGCNLQRRQLSAEQWERLSEEFQAKLREIDGTSLGSEKLDAIGAAYRQLASGELTPSDLERLRPWIDQLAPSAPAAPTAVPPETEARLAELNGKLEESKRLIRKLQAERDQLREAVEVYESAALAPSSGDAALKHATKELTDARRRLVDLSQQLKQAKDDKERLDEELERARAREKMWTNGERQLLLNELDITQQENQRLRDLLRTAPKAVALIEALQHTVREIYVLLDHQHEPWTDEERRQVSSAYEQLVKAWEELREPLSLALGGLPPGRSVFDRMFPDKRHREPLERYLDEQAAREAAALEAPGRNGHAPRRKSGKGRRASGLSADALAPELDEAHLLEEVKEIDRAFGEDGPAAFSENALADCEDD